MEIDEQSEQRVIIEFLVKLAWNWQNVKYCFWRQCIIEDVYFQVDNLLK